MLGHKGKVRFRDQPPYKDPLNHALDAPLDVRIDDYCTEINALAIAHALHHVFAGGGNIRNLIIISQSLKPIFEAVRTVAFFLQEQLEHVNLYCHGSQSSD